MICPVVYKRKEEAWWWWIWGGGSDDGSLGGGEVDGLDADRQRLLQLLQDVTAGAFWGCVVQQLFEGLQLDEDHHVLQEVALDVGRQLWGVQELRSAKEKTCMVFITGYEESEVCSFFVLLVVAVVDFQSQTFRHQYIFVKSCD